MISNILKRLRSHLSDNKGDVNMDKVIMIMIVFVIGAILVTAIVTAINQYYKNGSSGKIHDILN